MAETQQLQISKVDEAKIVTFINTPELDYFTTSTVKGDIARIVAEAPRILIFDLSNVAYLDSTGVGLLLATHRSISREKHRFILCGINERIMELFRHSHLLRTFKISGDVDEAIRESW